jgi:hypothetical protein
MAPRKWSRVDKERLIDLVREHPSLYNQQLAEYRDLELGNNIWGGVCENFSPDSNGK